MEKYLWEIEASDYITNQDAINSFNTYKTQAEDLIKNKEEMKLRDFVDELVSVDNAIYNIFDNEQLQSNRFVNILKS